MFCEDPIQSVYVKRLVLNGDDAYLDCYNDLAYHFSGDFAVVMLTEREYLRFDRNGVHKGAVTEELTEQLRDVYDPCVQESPGKAPWIDYEHTLFCGERVLSVEHTEGAGETLVRFEDFDFRFVFHDSASEYPPSPRDGVRYTLIRGCERHLKRPCSACGGEGQMVMDFVGDYTVRCRLCKGAVRPQLFAHDALALWNDGRLQYVIEDEKIANLTL